jgi:hypothetical protein
MQCKDETSWRAITFIIIFIGFICNTAAFDINIELMNSECLLGSLRSVTELQGAFHRQLPVSMIALNSHQWMVYKLIHLGTECSRVAAAAVRDFAATRTRGSTSAVLTSTEHSLLSHRAQAEGIPIVVPTFKTPNSRLLPNVTK